MMGYQVDTVHSQRQAMAVLKNTVPDVVVAEFNYVSTFRDRISNLESLLARLQISAPVTRVILIFDAEHEAHLDRITQRFNIFGRLRYPVSEEDFKEMLAQAADPADSNPA